MVKERIRLGTPEGKTVVKRDEFVRTVAERLEKLQKEMFAKARARLEKNVRTDIKTKKEFEEYFANSNVWIEEGKAGKMERRSELRRTAESDENYDPLHSV